MFFLNKDTELTPALISKMMNQFIVAVRPTLRNYKNYFDGKHAILNSLLRIAADILLRKPPLFHQCSGSSRLSQ